MISNNMELDLVSIYSPLAWLFLKWGGLLFFVAIIIGFGAGFWTYGRPVKKLRPESNFDLIMFAFANLGEFLAHRLIGYIRNRRYERQQTSNTTNETGRKSRFVGYVEPKTGIEKTKWILDSEHAVTLGAFDTSSLLKGSLINAKLSLYVLDIESGKLDDLKFTINPRIVETGEVKDGISVRVNTNGLKGGFLEFNLPKEFFKDISSKAVEFIIRLNDSGCRVFFAGPGMPGLSRRANLDVEFENVSKKIKPINLLSILKTNKPYSGIDSTGKLVDGSQTILKTILEKIKSVPAIIIGLSAIASAIFGGLTWYDDRQFNKNENSDIYLNQQKTIEQPQFSETVGDSKIIKNDGSDETEMIIQNSDKIQKIEENIHKGESYLDEMTGLAIGLSAVRLGSGGIYVARLNISVPFQESILYDDVEAGSVIDFNEYNIPYRLLIKTIDYYSDSIDFVLYSD